MNKDIKNIVIGLAVAPILILLSPLILLGISFWLVGSGVTDFFKEKE